MDENWKSKAGFGTGEKTNSKFEEFIKTRLALQVRKDGENLPEIKIMRSNKNAIHGVAICYKNSHEVREALAEFKAEMPPAPSPAASPAPSPAPVAVQPVPERT